MSLQLVSLLQSKPSIVCKREVCKRNCRTLLDIIVHFKYLNYLPCGFNLLVFISLYDTFGFLVLVSFSFVFKLVYNGLILHNCANLYLLFNTEHTNCMILPRSRSLKFVNGK